MVVKNNSSRGRVVAKKFSTLRERITATPEQRARAGAEREAMRLALALGKLREQRGATQVETAAAMGVSQVNVSRIEREENVYLSTLARYVAALGGQLRIEAVFPDMSVSLLGLAEGSRQPTMGDEQTYTPGTEAPVAAQYGVVGPRGGDTGKEVTVPKGKTLPPTPKPGQQYRVNDPTKNASGRGAGRGRGSRR
jgi:transcriptional regulator with XRE-family HTH domain